MGCGARGAVARSAGMIAAPGEAGWGAALREGDAGSCAGSAGWMGSEIAHGISAMDAGCGVVVVDDPMGCGPCCTTSCSTEHSVGDGALGSALVAVFPGDTCTVGVGAVGCDGSTAPGSRGELVILYGSVEIVVASKIVVDITSAAGDDRPFDRS